MGKSDNVHSFINAKAEIIILARNVEPNETQTMVLISIKGQIDL